MQLIFLRKINISYIITTYPDDITLILDPRLKIIYKKIYKI